MSEKDRNHVGEFFRCWPYKTRELTVDGLLCQPFLALQFAEDVKTNGGMKEHSTEEILRLLMAWRKRGAP